MKMLRVIHFMIVVLIACAFAVSLPAIAVSMEGGGESLQNPMNPSGVKTQSDDDFMPDWLNGSLGIQRKWTNVAPGVWTTSAKAYDLLKIAARASEFKVAEKALNSLINEYADDYFSEGASAVSYREYALDALHVRKCEYERGHADQSQERELKALIGRIQDAVSKKDKRELSALASCYISRGYYPNRVGTRTSPAEAAQLLLANISGAIDWKRADFESEGLQSRMWRIRGENGNIVLGLLFSEYDGGWRWTGVFPGSQQ